MKPPQGHIGVNVIFTDYALSSANQFLLEIFPRWHDFYIDVADGPKALRLILQGLGYGILPKVLVQPYLETKELEMVPALDFDFPDYQCYVVHKEEFENPMREGEDKCK